MRSTAEHETDVLIVGAGPTGLTLACELLRRGVSCRIIDRAASPATTSRALGLQPRTLELFDTMGIIDRVLATGGPVIDANLYAGDRLLLTLSTAGLRNLATPYPRLWITPQASVERPLIERLLELGGTVERSRELADFRQMDSRVIATVRHGDSEESEEIHASWLVGCDGARSRVRKTLGVSFEGSTYEEKFLLADVDLDWSRERDRTHTWFPQDGMFSVFPLPGTLQWRIFAVLEGETEPPSLELFQRLFSERTGDIKTNISDPTWMSDFAINRRMVDRYRIERAFLAGDAAHVHSPFGAQGMNTGIQDAYNLGWKLALVVQGEASERLLDTYEEERLPVARRVLAQTDTNTRVLLSNNPVMRFLRERVLTLGPVQDHVARRSSQLFINYRSSSLSQSPGGTHVDNLTGKTVPRARASEKAGLKDLLRFRGGPRAGDRAPNGPSIRAASREKTNLFREFRGTSFNLLLFDGMARTETGYANLLEIARRVEGLPGNPVKTHLIVGSDSAPEELAREGSVLLDGPRSLHELYGARAESLYLIRPDGYLGFRGQTAEVEPLIEYLRSKYADASGGKDTLYREGIGKKREHPGTRRGRAGGTAEPARSKCSGSVRAVCMVYARKGRQTSGQRERFEGGDTNGGNEP
jgi:2-polyprenyl-6-methoxyphenol hydroxylase-like FAD-dependent oxidoreductase